MSELAIDGGPRVRSEPVPPWPFYEQDEIDAVSAVLRSGKVNQWTGTKVFEFQNAYAAAVGVPHAIALANGSLAIELALRAYGIGPGDEVIVTPRSFIASASCVDLVGAKPVFADIDPETQNLSVASIADCITPRSKAIIPVHLAGWPCDMKAIMELADEHDLIVIEDCAQAHGATIGGAPVGIFGHASAFSFCQDKIITTGGEGGLVLFKDHNVWQRAWSFKDHGKNHDAMFSKDHAPGYRWVHDSVGTNWRMTEIQAVIGLLQLGKLAHWQSERQRKAEFLLDAFSEIDAFEVPRCGSGITHAYYRAAITVKTDRLAAGWDRNRILAAIAAEGVGCYVGSSPGLFLEKAYSSRGWNGANSPVALDVGARSLVFLVHNTVDQQYLDDTVSAVRKVMGQASK